MARCRQSSGRRSAALLYGPSASARPACTALARRCLRWRRCWRSPSPRPRPPVEHESAWRSVLVGLRFVRAQPVILRVGGARLFAVLLGGATALLPVFASDILHVGPSGLGVLRSAPAAGAAAMALVLAHRPLTRRAGPKMLACVALFGAATIVFGLSRSLALSLAALVVLGASDMVSVVMRSTVVQLRRPTAMRGRVGAVSMLFVARRAARRARVGRHRGVARRRARRRPRGPRDARRGRALRARLEDAARRQIVSRRPRRTWRRAARPSRCRRGIFRVRVRRVPRRGSRSDRPCR